MAPSRVSVSIDPISSEFTPSPTDALLSPKSIASNSPKDDLSKSRRRRNSSVSSASSTTNPTTTTTTSRRRGSRASNKPKPTFQCTVCAAVFKRSEHLVRHYRSHTLERPFGCTSCGTCFTRKDLLVRHQRTCKGVPSRRRRKSVLTVVSSLIPGEAPAAPGTVATPKQQNLTETTRSSNPKSRTMSLNLISSSSSSSDPKSHSRSASIDAAALHQKLPSDTRSFMLTPPTPPVNFTGSLPTGFGKDYSSFETFEKNGLTYDGQSIPSWADDKNHFQNSLVDPLLSMSSRERIQNGFLLPDEFLLQNNNSHRQQSASNDDDSDLRSNGLDGGSQSPHHNNQKNNKTISNNYSQYPFGLESDMDVDDLDYEKVCHLSTSNTKSNNNSNATNNNNNGKIDVQYPIFSAELAQQGNNKQYNLDAQRLQNLCTAFRNNPNLNTLASTLANTRFRDVSANNNYNMNHNMDGISMLNPNLSRMGFPNNGSNFWNFQDRPANNNNNNVINKRFQSLFNNYTMRSRSDSQQNTETSPTTNPAGMEEGCDNQKEDGINLHSTLQCDNFFNLYNVPGSSKVFTNNVPVVDALSDMNESDVNSMPEIPELDLDIKDSSSSPSSTSSASTLDDPSGFASHLSQYYQTSEKAPVSQLPFDYQVLPNTKSTTSILDFFAGATGAYTGPGNDILDPEILRASS